MNYKCDFCQDSGSLNHGSDILDCTHCNVVTERLDLRNWLHSQTAYPQNDSLAWAIHQRALALAAAAPKVVADERNSDEYREFRQRGYTGEAILPNANALQVRAWCEGLLAREPKPWMPSPENINALPKPIKAYIHDITAIGDYNYIVHANTFLKDQCEGLQRELVKARAALAAAPVQPVAVPDGWRGADCEVFDTEKQEWLACKFISLSFSTVLMEPIVQIPGRMPWFATWGSVRGLPKDAVIASYSAAPAAQGDANQAAIDVIAERKRQIESEGWKEARDDRYIDCELARAAATYALCLRPEELKICGVNAWPWPAHWWKPTSYRRNLVKSGALILAEIERIDRAAIAAKAAS